MDHLLFTVYDVKAEVFLPPFFVPTLGLAIRAFADCVNSPEHQFGKHPHDYTLFTLGTFTDHDAEFDLAGKKSLGNGVEFIDKDHVDSFGDHDRGQTDPPIQPN